MKKLRLNLQVLENTEVLTKKQLKKVVGGFSTLETTHAYTFTSPN